MKKMWRTLAATVLVFGAVCMATRQAWAQDVEPAAAEQAAPAAGEEKAVAGAGFIDIVYGDSLVNLLIWCMLGVTSCATVALIVDSLISVKREKLLPSDVVDGVRGSLDSGDLGAALETCEANPGPLSTILMVGFANITEGYEVIQEAIASSAEMENEKLMQRINYLNLCGQIAPMLGLMGTVTGMVSAFSGLATASAATKATVLAISISTALWTTCVGLLISVPALLGYTLVRNYATRIVLETEATVLDLIKVLRTAEVEEE